MMHKTVGSVTGPSHITNGTPCQDVAAIYESNGFTLLVVADGAGSLTRSDEGAAVAAASARESLEDVFDASVDSAIHIVDSARADLLELDDSEMGCTLAILITDGPNWAVAGIGDSFVVVDSDTGLEAFSSEPSEYANITQLLTSQSVDVWSSEGSGFRAGAACSDGLEHHTLKAQQPHEGFWQNVFNRVVNGDEIQPIIDFMNHSEMLDDDTSAAICVVEDSSE